MNAIKKLKTGIGPDMIHANHLKICSDDCVKMITYLFNACLVHRYTCIDILKGVINPTIKDKLGNINDSNNYRPVMLSSMFLKLFEYCLIEEIQRKVILNDRQHGYQEKYSVTTAGLSLKETICKYTNSGSKVFACFVDISKAFDSVNHKILINKLIKYNVPLIYINLIKYWYSHQFVKVKFANKFSYEWKICNGVRQGGVLSGLLFSIYIDSLLNEVTNSKIGCKLGLLMSNIIAYADDLVLLSPSPESLQKLIDLLQNETNKIDLKINLKKTKCMIFCSESSSICKIKRCFTLEKEKIEYVTSFKYLGNIIQNDMINAEDIKLKRNNFFKDFNSIYRKFSFVNSSVLLYLFKQYCMQFYGANLWSENRKSKTILKQFEIGYHKALKKILGLSTHESNHYACQEANLLTFKHYVNKIKIISALKLFVYPCRFFDKLKSFMIINSDFFRYLYDILLNEYEIKSVFRND